MGLRLLSHACLVLPMGHAASTWRGCGAPHRTTTRTRCTSGWASGGCPARTPLHRTAPETALHRQALAPATRASARATSSPVRNPHLPAARLDSTQTRISQKKTKKTNWRSAHRPSLTLSLAYLAVELAALSLSQIGPRSSLMIQRRRRLSAAARSPRHFPGTAAATACLGRSRHSGLSRTSWR